MEYSSITQHLQLSSGGRPTPPSLALGTTKLEPRDFMKLEPAEAYNIKLESSASDFEPQTRARSNTWPQPRPEEPPVPNSGGPPPLPENDAMTQGLLGFPKKSTSRRNAWGNMSYADLITQAIQSSPDKRLTLSQIYDWMVTNVSYFKDKGDSNSSAGWKVSRVQRLFFSPCSLSIPPPHVVLLSSWYLWPQREAPPPASSTISIKLYSLVHNL